MGTQQIYTAQIGDAADYGVIEYNEKPKGYIEIVNSFVQDYLVRATFPIIGAKLVHYRLHDPLMWVLKEIEYRSRYDMDYDYITTSGVFSPRHCWHLRNKPLSFHAFALAIDVDAYRNLPNTVGSMPDGIVELFEANGFEWGGRWRRVRDPMHFQLVLQH